METSVNRVAPYPAKYNDGQNFLFENVSARKWNWMILSKHALKGNGDTLVKEFLSTLGSAKVRLIGSRESDASRVQLEQFNIFWGFSVSYSFACHVSWKVKYFGKVANV